MRKFLIISLLLFPSFVFAVSPTRVGTDVSGAFAAAASDTLAITVSSTGQNHCGIVLVGPQGTNAVPSSVTWNGTSMGSPIVNLTGAQQTTGLMYYLAAPTTGNIVVNWSPNQAADIIAFVLQDCAQSSPLDVSGQANTAGNTALATSITTTVNNDLIINWLGVDPNVTNITANAGQSNIAGGTVSGVIMKMNASDIAQATAGAISTGYTWTTSKTADDYAAAIKYLAPSTATAVFFPRPNPFWW